MRELKFRACEPPTGMTLVEMSRRHARESFLPPEAIAGMMDASPIWEIVKSKGLRSLSKPETERNTDKP